MIQFNLLPDVKLEYAKAQRTKRTVMGMALIATAASFTLFALLFLTVHVVQKNSISDLDKDIKKYSTELRDTPDLNKILTIQNQLGSIGGLHENKVVASRATIIMQQVTPATVTISTLLMDYEQGILTVSGETDGLDKVNTFIDSLKFATFDTKDERGQKPFTKVVLSQFSRDEEGTSYTITAAIDPELFSGRNDIELTVPKTPTTRSVLEQPTGIFKQTDSTNTQGTR